MFVSAIVLAAGRGLRFKSRIPKQLIEINAKPVIIYSLETLSMHSDIKEIILVVSQKNLKGIVKKIRQYRIKKIRDVVLGGRLRQDSVRNGLKAIDSRADLVLIHDAVRPFISKDNISSVIKEAKRYGAAILGEPVKATIKEVRSQKSEVRSQFIVKRTLDRNSLWEVQTPQVFKKELILKAYNKFGDRRVTDDASLVEKLGSKVRIVRDSYFNIKITTPEDLVIAEAIAKKCHIELA